MTKADSHIPALDGIRGLAVLIVFTYHYGGGAQSSLWPVHAVGVALRAGWCGVTLFFLLSGFLITGILWDGRHRQGWWRRFYWRRTLRIFPLYYLALVLVFATAVAAGGFHLAIRHIWVFVFYLQDIPLPARLFAIGSPLVLSHFWSLAVEEQFYLFWPFAIVNLRSPKQARAVCLAVFVASLLFRFTTYAVNHDISSWVVTLPGRAGELAAGGFLAMSFREAAAWRRLQKLAPYGFFGGALAFVLAGVKAQTLIASAPAIFLVGLPCLTVSLGSLLVLALQPGLAQRAMSAGWLRYLGRISYGIYVFHVLLAPLFAAVVTHLAPHAGRELWLVLEALVAASLTLVTAELSFHFFEQPFLRLKDRVSTRQPKEVRS